MDAKQRPIETFRDGRLKASIWQNESDKGPYHTVTMAKVYEDRSGKLQETNSFSSGELLRVAELAREAHTYVRDIRRDLAQDRRSEPQREDRPGRFQDRPERSSGPNMGR